MPGTNGNKIKPQIFIPDEPKKLEVPKSEVTERQTRRVKLSKGLFADPAIGHTVGCPACDNIRAGLNQVGNHSEKCRNIVEHKLEEREDPMYQRAIERMMRKVSEKIEESCGPSSSSSSRGHNQQGNQESEDVRMEEGDDAVPERDPMADMEEEEPMEETEKIVMGISMHDPKCWSGGGIFMNYHEYFNDELKWLHVKRDISRGAHMVISVPGRHEVILQAKREKGKISERDSKEADVHWERAKELMEAQALRGRYFVTECTFVNNNWEGRKFGDWVRNSGYYHELKGDVAVITNSKEISENISQVRSWKKIRHNDRDLSMVEEHC